MIFTNKELLLSPCTWYESNVNKIGDPRLNPQFLYVDSYNNNIRASIGVKSITSLDSIPKEKLSEIMELYNEHFKNNISDIEYHKKSILNSYRELYEGYYEFFTWYYDVDEDIALYWRFKLEGIGAILS